MINPALMKLLHFTTVTILTLFLSACAVSSPTYFGSKYPATTKITSFYSALDVKQPFKVIGHMNAVTGNSESGQEKTRKAVLKKAKEIGGDGVIFSEINRQVNRQTTDDYTVKVDVIKFQ